MSKIFGIIVAIFVVAFFLSFIPTLLWYTFDDQLAMITGIDNVG